MRHWIIGIMCTLVLTMGVNTATAQRRGKLNQKDLGKSGLDSRKYLNKSWLDLQNGTLPAFSFSFEAQAGMINILTDEPNVELSLPFGLLAPGIQLNFNPSDMFGLHFGAQGRMTDVYYRSFDDFSNGGKTYFADGEWQHQIRSFALNYGFSFYGNLTRKSITCTGYGLRKRSDYTHFMLHVGMVMGNSLIDELTFVGKYRVVENGEVIEREDTYNGKMLSADGRRSNRQMFGYVKPGLRFQYGNYATRLCGFFEYQMNQNTGLVNDFSPHSFSSMIYGIQLGFEFM